MKTRKTIQRCVITTNSLCKTWNPTGHSLTDLLADLPVLKKRKHNKQSVVVLYKG